MPQETPTHFRKYYSLQPPPRTSNLKLTSGVDSRITIKVTLYTSRVEHLLDHTIKQIFVNTTHTRERKTMNVCLL